MTPTPTLRELIDSVRADAPGDDALVQLSQASRAVADLEQTADSLLGHFVDQCRRSGRSWSEISGALGVSKQAAHKRFSFDVPRFERFTARARSVLAHAEEEAQGLGHGFVGTEHLLLPCSRSPRVWRHRFLRPSASHGQTSRRRSWRSSSRGPGPRGASSPSRREPRRLCAAPWKRRCG